MAMLKKIVSVAVPFAVAAGGLYWVLKDLPLSELAATASHAMQTAATPWLVAAVLGYVVLAALHGWRFSAFLSLTAAHGVAIYAIATLLNTFIPARAGDLYKPHQSSIHNKRSFAEQTGHVLSDLIVWGAGFVVWLIPLLPWMWPVLQRTPMLGWALLFQVGGSLLGLGAIFAIDAYVRRHSIKPKYQFLHKGLELVSALRTGVSLQRVRRVWLLVIVGWAAEMFIPFAVARGFALPISFVEGAVVMMAVTVAMVVPSPGGVGPFEAAATAVFESYGAERSLAAFLAITYHLVFIVTPVALGMIGWWYESLSTAPEERKDTVKNV